MATVQDLLRQAGATLQAEGIESGDARPLLAEVLGVARDRLVLMAHDPVTSEQEQAYEALIAARLRRVPVSKLLGRRLFWGMSFEVTADTLDPRPETESLIAAALSAGAPKRLLDLGTGTGCIALSLLSEWPDTRGLACDISPAALEVAKRNARHLDLADRCELRISDWYSEVSERFDLIVSNPPYISQTEMAELSREVHDHDPHLALTPGGDGLAPYHVLASGALAHLEPGGRLLVEIGWRQGPDVARIFAAAGLCQVEVLPDMDGRDRVVSAVSPTGV